MDHLTNEKRSWNMSRIRSSNTSPEIKVRSFLHRNGFRFRISNKLPGKPDLYLKKYNTVIFIHGCFWHRHTGCKRATMPKSNTEYWEEKFKKNVIRDEKTTNELKDKGYRVFIVWECQVRDNLFLDTLAFSIKNNIRDL